jgi:anaphase-promoting complex subunit 3
MQSDSVPSFFPFLSQRFYNLVWSCLDADLHRSAVFHAERYFAMDKQNHDARHLYATALLHAGQTYSAMCLVNVPPDVQCSGCLDLKAKCCTLLGRHRQAREALEEALQDTKYTSTGL